MEQESRNKRVKTNNKEEDKAVSVESATKFIEHVQNLKTVERTGWRLRGLDKVESVADHSYSMAMMGFLITDEEINKDHLIKLCLLHDFAETIVGDIPPFKNSGITNEEKNKRERSAADLIFKKEMKNHKNGIEMHKFFEEYEDRTTKEAKLVKDLDRYEMIAKAYHYEVSQNVDLSEFFESVKNKILHYEVKQWTKELEHKHQDFLLKKNSSSSSTTA